MKAFLILILITSCATKIPGNYLVPKEGDSGGVIFFSEKPNFDAYEIRNKDGIVYAVGLPFVTEDTLENIGGYELLVKNKDFGESRITIDNQSFIAPNNDQRERASSEYLLVQKIISGQTPQHTYDLNFIPPVNSIITSAYGKKRFINNVPRSPHLATDLRGSEGTPILAPKKGKAVLVANHFYSGNIIILDHGGGLFTSYSHLQKFNLSEGDIVNAGTVIGYVGSTGRVTASHLHWTIYLNKRRINPELFIDLEYKE